MALPRRAGYGIGFSIGIILAIIMSFAFNDVTAGIICLGIGYILGYLLEKGIPRTPRPARKRK